MTRLIRMTPVVHLYNMLVTGDKPKNEINWSWVDIIDERGIYELL